MTELPKYISFFKENRTATEAQAIYNQRVQDSREVFEKFSSEFYSRPCPICGSHEYTEEEKFDGNYGVAKCCSCGSLYVNPTPSLNSLEYYYNECKCNEQLGALLKHRSKKGGKILSDRTRYVVDLIQALLVTKDNIKVLEVGCNSGAFLNELNLALTDLGLSGSVEVLGIDIDKSAVENPVCEELNLFHSSAEEFVRTGENSFDLILHFELIEHLNDPFSFCEALNRLLCENGVMYFHTPNILGMDNKAISYNEFRPLAHGIFPPMHLNAFSTQNVGHFLLRAGFKIKCIETPGSLDVDIVRQFAASESQFSILKSIASEQYLAIVQKLLTLVNASAHMAVTAEK